MPTESPTEQFFDELNRLGHEPLLEKARGTIRIELVDGETTDIWFIVIDRGRIRVVREHDGWDALLRASRAVFDRIAAGEENGTTAFLRGEYTSLGQQNLNIQLARLFPGPPGTRARRLVATRGRRVR